MRLGLSGSFGLAWVHSSGLSAVGFIGVRVGSLGRAYVSPGIFGFACVQLGLHMGGQVYSGSRGFNPAQIGVAGFIRVPVGSLGCA